MNEIRTRLRGALEEIAANFAFSWHEPARDLFERVDPALWSAVDHNPTAFLADLEAVPGDPQLAADAERVRDAIAVELIAPAWWDEEHGEEHGFLTAYFSAEFGVDESLPIYSGGLGVLAGDHLKSASELGVPLVGVGLLYRQGYFRQALDESGRQRERYPENDPRRLALTEEPVTVHVDLAGETVAARVWRADVGRTRLYLLDTDLEENSARARRITDVLYGGDREHRLRQEIVLGVGGVRALEALGLVPSVFHMNEGHSAFLALERIRALVAHGRPLGEALAEVRASSVFTTHTPVPAGNEVFDPELLRTYLSSLVAACGLGWDDFLALGASDGSDGGFGMTALALRVAGRANGVSQLHGEVSRRMWAGLFPGEGDAPIGSVTNGVHARTWISGGLEQLLRSRGVRPEAAPGRQSWERAQEVELGALWQERRARKRILAARAGLDPDALTIGFARRFATYKRAGLLFSDPERLARLLADDARPLQIVLAGKAHPADEGGKDVMQDVVEFSRGPLARGRVVFLADYEMSLARRLVQGVDVWLNTPCRPQEASGTSGMKAALNGVLNASILDGWWAEACDPSLGFAIGGAEEAHDERDAEALYRTLEERVLPAYYERDEDGVPRRWLALARTSIARVGATFTTGRMVAEYVERYYLPAHRDAGHAAAATRAA
jgi:starch phosphorylase